VTEIRPGLDFDRVTVHEVSRHFLDGTTNGSPFAHVLRLRKDAHLRMFCGELLGDLPSPVTRPIVHHHDFALQSTGQRRRQDRLQTGSKRFFLVIGSYEDGEFMKDR